MEITMSARYFDLNDELKDAIHSRLSRIENQFKYLSQAEIVLTQEAHYQFHVNLKVDGGKEHFHATALDYELLRGVDKAVRRIRDQADKVHKKRAEHFKHHLPQRKVIERLETNGVSLK